MQCQAGQAAALAHQLLQLHHCQRLYHVEQQQLPGQQQQKQQQQHTQHLAALVRQHFPPISYGFAYGSGVFVQPDLYEPTTTAKASGPMLDFIFAVDDAEAWHAQNMQLNPSHYSFLRLLGPQLACHVAERIGVGVYFNTLVPLGNEVVKYGVVGEPALLQDLHHWSHLYVAGRLHKPVAALASQPAAEAAVQANLHAALSTALLLLPRPSASLKDLFKRITSLSYLGDVRMGLAEDSKKVERIVAGSYGAFKDTYLPLLQAPTYQGLGVTADEQGVQQQQLQQHKDSSIELMSRLPSVLLSRMAGKLHSALQPQHTAAVTGVLAGAAASVSAQLPQLSPAARRDIAAAVLASGRHRSLLKGALHAIVAGSSRRQAVAGLLYAGPVKSLRYLGRKLAKAWK